MARKQNERVEHYRASFADLSNVLKWDVDVTDTLIGAAAGLAGVAGAKWAANKFAAQVPEFAKKAVPLMGGLVTGAGLYFAFGGTSKAKSLATGAAFAGAAVNAWDLLKGQFPDLADPVILDLAQYGYLTSEQNVLAPQSAYSALIDDPRPGMAELGAVSMSEDEDDAP